MKTTPPTDPNPVIDAALKRLWAGEKEVLMGDAWSQLPDAPSRRATRPADYVDLSARLRSYGVGWKSRSTGTWLFREGA